MSPEGMSVTKRQELKKWRRRPREVVKKTGSDLTVSSGEMEQVSVNGNGNSLVSNVLYGDSGLDGGFAARADTANSEDHSSRCLTAASVPRMKHEITSLNGGNSVLPGDHRRNGHTRTSKKARGFELQKENSHSSMRSDSRSSNFVFVQGTNFACKGKERCSLTKYDEEYSDENLNKEDVEAEISCKIKEENIGKREGSMDEDALVKTLAGLDFAYEELEREVQKWMDVGKDEPITLNQSIVDILAVKDAKILELESAITSGVAKNELEDLLNKIIEAEVEYIVITRTTERISDEMKEKKYNVQVSKNEGERLKAPSKDIEGGEDVRKLENGVCRCASYVIVQFILFFVTLHLQLASQNVEVVPT